MRAAAIAVLATALLVLAAGGAAAQQELKAGELPDLLACKDSCPEQRCIRLQCLTPASNNRVSRPPGASHQPRPPPAQAHAATERGRRPRCRRASACPSTKNAWTASLQSS